MEVVIKPHVDWYTRQEQDQLLEGMFRLEPQWYLFYSLTTRLGVRRGEVCAITHRQLRREPPRPIVDPAVQRETKTKQAKIVSRKNDEAYVLDLTEDVLAAVDWHQGAGYAGRSFYSRGPAYFLVHRQPRRALEARTAETRTPIAQPPQGGAAFGGEPGGHERRIREGGAGPTRASVHAPMRACRLRRSTPARRGVEARTRSPTRPRPPGHGNLATTTAQGHREEASSAPTAQTKNPQDYPGGLLRLSSVARVGFEPTTFGL